MECKCCVSCLHVMCGSDINDMRTLSLVLRGLLHRLLHNKLANTAKSIVQYCRVPLFGSATSATRQPSHGTRVCVFFF